MEVVIQSLPLSSSRSMVFLHRYRRRFAKGFECDLQLLVEDVGVDHCSGQVRVAKHLLY